MLTQIMPTDDSHTIINSTKKIDVLRDCLMTFKIPC